MSDLTSVLAFHGYRIVTAEAFREAFEAARKSSPIIAEMTSQFEEVPLTIHILHEDGRSGFAVRRAWPIQDNTGEIVFLHSLEPGRGDVMVTLAKMLGGRFLDCFDGYLPTLYGRHGFVETHREPNYTIGKPDVVWMSIP